MFDGDFIDILIIISDDDSAGYFNYGLHWGQINLLMVHPGVDPSSCLFVSLGVYLFPTLYILFAYACACILPLSICLVICFAGFAIMLGGCYNR